MATEISCFRGRLGSEEASGAWGVYRDLSVFRRSADDTLSFPYVARDIGITDRHEGLTVALPVSLAARR